MSVVALIHEGVIELNPPYQRGVWFSRSFMLSPHPTLEVVWPESKQVKLLDSIWRNYYVPPIVFTVARDDTGEEIRSCVDGKQRLTSIQKFFDGQVRTTSSDVTRIATYPFSPRFHVRLATRLSILIC